MTWATAQSGTSQPSACTQPTSDVENGWRIVVVSCRKLHYMGEFNCEDQLRERLLTKQTLQAVQHAVLQKGFKLGDDSDGWQSGDPTADAALDMYNQFSEEHESMVIRPSIISAV